jgi:hypothetical protein
MTPSDYLSLLFSFAAGGVAAVASLAVLWCSVMELKRRRSYMPLVVGGAARAGLFAVLVLIAFHARPAPFEILAAAFGFVLVRLVTLKMARGPTDKQIGGAKS